MDDFLSQIQQQIEDVEETEKQIAEHYEHQSEIDIIYATQEQIDNLLLRVESTRLPEETEREIVLKTTGDLTLIELIQIYDKIKADEPIDCPRVQFMRFQWTHENPLFWFRPSSMKTFFNDLFKYT